MDIGRVTTSGWSISTSGGTVSESKYAAWADGKSASLTRIFRVGKVGLRILAAKSTELHWMMEIMPNFTAC